MVNYDTVKADFNEISQLAEPKWNHSSCYYKFILKHLPANPEICLDIGCGKGALSFLLSEKSKKVVAVDLAEKMIEEASRLHPAGNIEYICADIFDINIGINIGNESLDAIITVATAHHLPYEELLRFAAEKLRPGGRLIILDIYKAKTISDYALSCIAFVPNIIMNLIHNGRPRKDDGHSKDVWKRHGEHDEYMTIAEIRAQAAKNLTNAKVRRKLFFRYALTWEKQF